MQPGPYTLRELIAMRKAKETESWDRFAMLIATVRSFVKATKIEDVHPYRDRVSSTPGIPATADNLMSLKGRLPAWQPPSQ